VFVSLKFKGALLGLVCAAFALMTESASAATAEVAKKCNALTDKAFPPLVVGNPAAGRKGTPKEWRDYRSKCIENEGHVPAK
jgi:hypothetical protein